MLALWRRKSERTMCCIQVVPLLGKEQMKTSEERSFSEAHFWIVSLLDMGSRGMGAGAGEDNILVLLLDDLVPSLSSWYTCQKILIVLSGNGV